TLFTDGRPRQVAGDLAVVLVEDGRHLGRLVRSLEENDLPNYRVDVRVRELDLVGRREPALQLKELGSARHRRLPRADDQERRPESLTALLGDLLNLVRAVRAVADVLLDLVDGKERTGELPVPRERISDRLDHLLVGDIGPIRERREEVVAQPLDRCLPARE